VREKNSCLMKKRLAIIATHPIQYQVPVWRLLTQEPDLDVHVYYGSDFSVRGYKDAEFGVAVKWDVALTDGYPYTFLSHDPNVNGASGFFELRATNLGRHLREFKPDCALIGGYLPFFWWEALWAARLLKVPVLIRAETTDAARQRNALKRILRRLFLHVYYGECERFLAIGQRSSDHYLAKGIAREQIGWSPYCVDTDLFERQAAEYLPQRAALRYELGFAEDQTVFIFSGKIYPHKDPFTLVRAFQALSDLELKQVGLIVLGDGVLRAAFEEECQRLLGQRAIFVGFVNQSQLGRYYAAADCLLLPSISETWGLVVNEAMLFGRPAIVSSGVGCHPDLVIDGQTGFVFPVGDAVALRQQISKIMTLLRDCQASIFERCRQQVAQYSTWAAAEGIRQAVFDLK
jgi:glycosyltransferase involved in cell wall biosynthesis